VEFHPAQGVRRANQRRCSIRAECFIGELRRPVTPDTVASYSLYAKIHFLGEQRDIETGAQPTANSSVIKRPRGCPRR
jgi:hypothetical protein